MAEVDWSYSLKLNDLLHTFDSLLTRMSSMQQEIKELKDELIKREADKVKQLDYETYGPDIQCMLDHWTET